jgi:hypothetical protein
MLIIFGCNPEQDTSKIPDCMKYGHVYGNTIIEIPLSLLPIILPIIELAELDKEFSEDEVEL